MIFIQLGKKSPASYRVQMSLTLFTKAHRSTVLLRHRFLVPYATNWTEWNGTYK